VGKTANLRKFMAKKKATKKKELGIIPLAKVPDYIHELTDGNIVRSLKTIRNWVYRGDLESVKVAGKVWVRKDSIDLYLSTFVEEM
jgi:hypothetical protein|tara:strand:- start:693 stop:950 length:258 start_codon:yes stop_codon:yes gene_type:complete